MGVAAADAVPRLYETFSSELAYDARGNPVGNTNNIMAVSDAELDAALDAERNAPDTGSLKLALHRAQQRLHELCVWIPGWREPYTHITVLALDTLAGISHPVLFPRIYNPLESHLYWVDEEMKKETLEARSLGVPFEEKNQIIYLERQDGAAP